MKVVFIVKYYDVYRKSFYSKVDKLQKVNYDDLVQMFVEDYFSFYCSLIQSMRAKGHQAELIIPNCEIVRSKWTEKIGAKDELNNFDFILSATDFYQPDVIFLSSNFEYYGNFAKILKSKSKALCAWISCPYSKDLDLSVFDNIFTLFPPYQKLFNESGMRSTLVTAGFDSAVLEKIKNENSNVSIPMSFVGGIGLGHARREFFLKKIGKKTPLHIWGYGFSSENWIKRILKNILKGFAFSRNYHGQAWGLDMFRILGQSKITVNINGDLGGSISVNMRLFEATGMGCLLLTDHADNITELFIPDVEIVTFKTPEEAIQKYNYYSSHESERKKIAEAGQKKTLALYSYNKIADTFIDEFSKALTK